MNVKAAIFACQATGVIGTISAALLWMKLGILGLLAGVVGSSLWFILAWYLHKRAATNR